MCEFCGTDSYCVACGFDPRAVHVVELQAEDRREYYTGRSGQGWTSPNLGEAFRYITLEGAAAKAAGFNEFTQFHGFKAIPVVSLA